MKARRVHGFCYDLVQVVNCDDSLKALLQQSREKHAAETAQEEESGEEEKSANPEQSVQKVEQS